MEHQDPASELYWSNLEKVYVHNVYESISSKYDEFLDNQVKQKKRNFSLNNCLDNNADTDLTKQLSEIDLNENKNVSAAQRKVEEKTKKCNVWPKVRDFLIKLEPCSLIGKNRMSRLGGLFFPHF